MEEDEGRGSAQGFGEAVGENGESSGEGSGWVTTKVAAKALGVSRRSVQGYVSRGILEAKSQGEGVNKTFLVSVDSLQQLLERRRGTTKDAPYFAEASSDEGFAAKGDESFGEMLRLVIEKMEARTAEAADLRARLQLTERAQSTLEEQARELREERDRLREELEAERSKGFWRRLFGG
jgi:hypothetical protein